MTRKGTIADNVTAKAVLKNTRNILSSGLQWFVSVEKTNNEVPNLFSCGSDTLNSVLLGGGKQQHFISLTHFLIETCRFLNIFHKIL